MQERFEQYLTELRKTNKYAQAFNMQVLSGYEEDMRALTAIVTQGARIMKNYRPTPTGGSGQAQAASYDMLGAYAILIELWGSPTQFADLDDDGWFSRTTPSTATQRSFRDCPARELEEGVRHVTAGMGRSEACLHPGKWARAAREKRGVVCCTPHRGAEAGGTSTLMNSVSLPEVLHAAVWAAAPE